MSESARTQSAVAYAFTPPQPVRADAIRAGVVRQTRGRWLVWSIAFAKRKASFLFRPMLLPLSALGAAVAAGCGVVSRFFMAVGTLLAGAFSSLCVWTAETAGHAMSLWYKLRCSLLRRVYRRVTLVCLFACAGLCVFFVSFYTLGLKVILDGESIGFVSSPAEFAHAVDVVSARASEILNYPYYPSPVVTYRYEVIDRTSVFNQTEVQDLLFSQVPGIKKLNILTVDDVQVAVTSDLEGLERILDRMLAAGNPGGMAQSVSFLQNVEISQKWTDAELERSLDEIASLLTTTGKKRYDSQGENETLDDVARRNGMNQEDLLALNAGPSNLPDALRETHRIPTVDELPDELLVLRPPPFLSVEAMVGEQYEEEIPYTSVSVDDDTIYVGSSKVRVAGEQGLAVVSVGLLYRDGQLYDCMQQGREIVVDPVDEVIAVGTRERPKKAPTGSFIRPYWGRLTSGFGYRSLFASNHEGVDFAGPIGDPIVAADGGTVSFAGVRNGYGNCVVIQHGNGFTTTYGHCSKLLVSAGQAVARGEQIAKVGNTGRSTGPHLHFEIRINGTPVNPLNYVG